MNGVTIPPDVAMTAQKPDLVIINQNAKEVKLVELTVPWDTSTNMAAALKRKTERYEDLAAEINGNGYKCFNIPLEIGTRGVVNSRNKAVLTQLCHAMKVTKRRKKKMSTPKIFTISHRLEVTDWKYLREVDFEPIIF